MSAPHEPAREAGALEGPRWRVAALASDLGRKPLAVTVVDRHLVLFRGPDGRPRALEDRCPHRGVPLSLGVCRGGTLACAYHGWRFDGAGTLLEVPSNVDEPLPRVALPAYAAIERDRLIWVAAGSEALGLPPDLELAGFAWRRWRLIEARPADVVRMDLALGGEVAWLAPDRAEAVAGGARTLLLLVPEGPTRTRVELMVGRKALWGRSRWEAGGPGWPVALGGDRLAPWLTTRGDDGDWRLERPLC